MLSSDSLDVSMWSSVSSVGLFTVWLLLNVCLYAFAYFPFFPHLLQLDSNAGLLYIGILVRISSSVPMFFLSVLCP